MPNAAINIKQAGQAIWARTYDDSQGVAQEAVEPRVKKLFVAKVEGYIGR